MPSPTVSRTAEEVRVDYWPVHRELVLRHHIGRDGHIAEHFLIVEELGDRGAA